MATWNAAPRVAFGSCQKRLLFPSHFAPDRTGNELKALRGSEDLGPGCYDNHNVGSLVYVLQHKPESKRGYVLAARTAPRFLPPVKAITTPIQQKQNWSQFSVCSHGRTPFNSSTPRFRDRDKPSSMNSSPGPGAYTRNTNQSKVSWPMKFNSPDWSRVPMLERKALRTELLCDRDFRKQRNRVAYLSLYY